MLIRFKPTGNVFDLPEKEAIIIYTENRGYDYEIIDGEIPLDNETPEKSTVYEQIVEDTDKKEEAETTETETEAEGKALQDYTVPELKAKLDNMGITYSKSAKKADLIALFDTDKKEEAAE